MMRLVSRSIKTFSKINKIYTKASIARCLTFLCASPIVMGDMKVKFLKQVTVDYEDAKLSEMVDKTFYRNQIVEVGNVGEDVAGFVNLYFSNGDTAVGIPKQGLTIL